MDLSSIRRMLVKTTGRKDLETDTELANFFVNSGIKVLDDKVQAPTMPSRHIVVVPVGLGVVYVKGLRSISSVYWQGSDGKISVLERKGEEELFGYYGMEIPSPAEDTVLPYDTNIFSETGTPVYYALLPISPSPEQTTMFQAGLETAPTTLGMKFSQEDDTVGLVIYKAPDVAGQLVVNGFFDRSNLSGDNDSNWWTATYPDLVVLAASYKIEVFNRNTEGQKDLMAALAMALQDVEKHIIDLEIGSVTEMEDSK